MLPKTCSVQHLGMCRARKVVNFAKPCLPTWLILSISSRQGNGRWLELNWNHVFKSLFFFNYTKSWFRPKYYVTFAKDRCHVCKKNHQLNTLRIIFFCYLFLLSLVFHLVFKINISGKIKAMSFHQFMVSTIANFIYLILLTQSTKYIWQAFYQFNAFREVCTMMIMRWCTVQKNEYDLQANTYPNNCTHHKLHNNNENKFPVFLEFICNKWQNIM